MVFGTNNDQVSQQESLEEWTPQRSLYVDGCCQTHTTFGTTLSDNVASARGLHASSEAMLALADSVAGLECSLHGQTPVKIGVSSIECCQLTRPFPDCNDPCGGLTLLFAQQHRHSQKFTIGSANLLLKGSHEVSASFVSSVSFSLRISSPRLFRPSQIRQTLRAAQPNRIAQRKT